MYKNTDCCEALDASGKIKVSEKTKIQIKDLCVLYVISWATIPVLSISSIFRLLAFFCCALFMVSTIFKLRGKILNYLLLSVALIVMLFGIIWIFQDDFDFAISRAVNLFVFAMLGLFSMYYYQYERSKLRIFCFYIVVLFFVLAVPSLIAVQSDPYIMRQASGEKIRSGIELFVGAYGYVYGCVFLVTILAYALKNGKQKVCAKVFQIILISFFVFLILNAGFTTAIILTVLGIIMSLSVRNSGWKTIIIFGIIGVVLISVIPVVLEYIFENFDIPQVYQQKLSVLMDITDSSGDTTYTDSTRGQLLVRGLDAILEYPILGSVILSGEHAAGAHQALVDVMANYGLLYAVIYYFVIYYTAFRQLKSEPKLQLVVGLLLFILGFTNTYDYTTFIIPLFAGPYIAERSVESHIKNHIYEEKVEKENVQL